MGIRDEGVNLGKFWSRRIMKDYEDMSDRWIWGAIAIIDSKIKVGSVIV